jgi:hypothetical protein
MNPLRELSGQVFNVTFRSPDGSTELVGKTVLHASGAGTRIPKRPSLFTHAKRFFGRPSSTPSPSGVGLPALPPGTTKALASHSFSQAPSSIATTVRPMDLPPGTRRG